MAQKFPPAGSVIGCAATNRVLYAEHALYDENGRGYDPEKAPPGAVPHPAAPKGPVVEPLGEQTFNARPGQEDPRMHQKPMDTTVGPSGSKGDKGD